MVKTDEHLYKQLPFPHIIDSRRHFTQGKDKVPTRPFISSDAFFGKRLISRPPGS